MAKSTLSIPELILLAGTRVAFGVGVGLLIANLLSDKQRKAAGVALAVVGGLTTIPLVMRIQERKTA